MNDITDSGNRWENAHPAGTDPQGGARAPAEPGGGTVVQERPDLDPGAGQPALAQKPPLRDRLREAPTGAKWAAGSAAAVVALAAVGVGGFAIGRATASHGDTGPGQLGPGVRQAASRTTTTAKARASAHRVGRAAPTAAGAPHPAQGPRRAPPGTSSRRPPAPRRLEVTVSRSLVQGHWGSLRTTVCMSLSEKVWRFGSQSGHR
ncbi:hypothetical protein [Nocardioides ungokensis]|uniref:hypothetical protein n=1 Tax=Nocardioides ungokensis TaxID=1643322 RepID=UPI0015DDBABC|nr:hypothetical protein [Nocardioides ungokensis]